MEPFWGPFTMCLIAILASLVISFPSSHLPASPNFSFSFNIPCFDTIFVCLFVFLVSYVCYLSLTLSRKAFFSGLEKLFHLQAYIKPHCFIVCLWSPHWYYSIKRPFLFYIYSAVVSLQHSTLHVSSIKNSFSLLRRVETQRQGYTVVFHIRSYTWLYDFI